MTTTSAKPDPPQQTAASRPVTAATVGVQPERAEPRHPRCPDSWAARSYSAAVDNLGHLGVHVPRRPLINFQSQGNR